MTKHTRLHVEALEDRRTPSFSPAASFPVRASPLAVVTGDFNGDGHLDLATANTTPIPEFPYATGTVSVLLGDGAGGFGAAIDSDVASFGFTRVSLTVADFDNDGDDDLTYAAHDPDNGIYGTGVGILLSNGNGTFGSITGSQAAMAVAAGDFNNDGNSDLAVIGYPRPEYDIIARVLLGNGQGGFTYSPYATALDRFYEELAVGDLNGDGNLDVVGVAGEYGGPGVALLGTGEAGGYSNYHEFYPTSVLSWDVAVGDFTGDGIPDLVTAGLTLDIHIGRGDGTFDEPTAYSTNAIEGVAVADFNGDGLLDAVTSDKSEGTVSELLGNGNGALTYAGAYAVGTVPSAIAVGDFNGDGRPDAATANAGSNTVSVLLNDGAWTPPPPALRIGNRTVMEGNTGAASATFTVTLSAASTETITVAYATGNGSATAGSDYQAASGTLTFAPGETSMTITVPVIGDRLGEPNETFIVNLSNATNATIGDGQGVGTITDDEPRVSISDVSKKEGKKNQKTLFTFTVTLSAAYDQPVTMSYATSNGTATTGDGDYVAKTGTLTFAPGETTKTITIEVKGDSKKEANETFYLDLTGLSNNALFTKNRGVGTILNDD
jgi:hypothetical protein